MRDNRDENPRNYDDREPRWLHPHHQGQNSDRGNYTIDSHFNRSHGDMDNSQYGSSYNFEDDERQDRMRRRSEPGGAHYAGNDYTRGRREDNPYGMSFTPSGEYNSGRHYDPRADYSDNDYDDIRRSGRPYNSPYNESEQFGHDIRRGDNDNWARGSIGDYESYRRNERGDSNYDNDYSGGFADRNYSEQRPHYGEGQYNSEFDHWSSNRGEDNNERYIRERDRRSNRR
jgi:hypothetical protein